MQVTMAVSNFVVWLMCIESTFIQINFIECKMIQVEAGFYVHLARD
jgi:hypothetical protein